MSYEDTSNIAISLKGVSKCFKIYDKPQDRLKQKIFKKKSKDYYKEFWALNNVSFEVKKGEVIGIIGKNGSGKSTILQIIANILKPTSGEVEVNGRVAALLELGSGFNPEYTGRENVYMNGAIMGLTIDEIKERLPLIEEFAEIGEFIDQPVKTYSSGMFVRLAFSCAIHVNPDILIIDEALAVGDMHFQLKCIEKMKSFKKEGKTILFVSHDSFTVRNFCDQAIWMMNGEVHARGDVKLIVEEYQDFMRLGVGSQDLNVNSTPSETNREILTINEIAFIDKFGHKKKSFEFMQDISIIVSYSIHQSYKGIVGGIALYDKENKYICGLNTKLDSVSLPSEPGNYQLLLNYKGVSLLPGTYFLEIGFFDSSAVVKLDYKCKTDYFRINSGEYLAEGLVYLNHNWETRSTV
ncbi:Vitamin B12 import ATP-binding protein BtuD [Paenibacillus solanacearum]|uniref:Vitamin B12 import ATP-binding protein BtuD n=1 Tax=Paenibacillus solanacearum TaxID=2048548 RepID=A0A916K8Q1_9BACL|nr:ABC transporter ATP-binding protein [Paenibacillus solanacearum]CAG7653237.1 Vitamin B12 import ATP-binding protein BtuD [Paenibacillus solanacearum]